LDEDLGHILAALSTNSYTWLSLTGAGSVALTTAQAEIINLSTNRPFYNQFTGGAWQQTLMSNNAYQKIFVMAIPTTADAGSQAYRYVFIQGQTQSTTLTTIQAVTAASLNLGELSGGLPEYCFIGEIIIRYTAGNWTLISVSKITGNRVVQTTTPAGNYLSQVSTDANFTGTGTTADPLSLAVKTKKIIGTTEASEGSATSVAHGLDSSKIIGVTGYVSVSAETNIIHGYESSSGYQFGITFGQTNVNLVLHPTNSENILSKSFTILIIYEA